jgi:hypothetical protein
VGSLFLFVLEVSCFGQRVSFEGHALWVEFSVDQNIMSIIWSVSSKPMTT